MTSHEEIKSEIDNYSQVILIGEEDGDMRIFWDTKDQKDVERLLLLSLEYIKSIK